MEIFGVGPLEFILILVLALVILGPEDMVGTARKIGQWVYRVVRSPTWRSIMATSQDLRNLPQQIVRDAGLEETMKEIKQTADEVKTDLNETTREISTEMQAATTEVNREMQIAAQDANAGMKEAGAEAQIAMTSAAAGLAGSENTIAPPQAQVGSAASPEVAPVPQEEPRFIAYKAQLETIASGLAGKEIQPAEPEESPLLRVTPAENTLPSAPPEEIQAEISPEQSYAAGLEMFSQALGAASASSRETEKPALEGLAPQAVGIPAGLNLNTPGGMEARLKKQMDEMMKSIEKLDAKIQASTGEEEATAPTPAEESMPASAQDTPHGNGTEPAAAPAKARRNAKRPLEAKPASGTETTGGEAPKAAPRKRAAKAAPLEAQAVAGKATQAAPRKKAEKAEPAAVEPSEGKAPKAAPRKRTAKKTPVPETTEQDSTSAQA